MSGGDSQRLFLALWPDGAVREELSRFLATLPGDLGRPVAAENLHVTLAFLGDVDGAVRNGVEAMVGGIRSGPFTLELDQVGYFPRPRILWAGAAPVPAQLAQLVKDVRKGLRRCGLQPERRPFVAHVTLMRKVNRFPGKLVLAPVFWPVRGISLVESQLGQTGSQYQVLREWPFSHAG